jgi:hypothetical protein
MTPDRKPIKTDDAMNSELEVALFTPRMLDGTRFRRAWKSVEHLYYLVLFSESPGYAGTPAPWREWIETGLDLAVRRPPAGARPQDWLSVSVYSGAREIRLRLRCEHADGLRLLERTLEQLEQQRRSETGESQRFEVLLHPLEATLDVAGVLEKERFLGLARQCFTTLLERGIDRIQIVQHELAS